MVEARDQIPIDRTSYEAALHSLSRKAGKFYKNGSTFVFRRLNQGREERR